MKLQTTLYAACAALALAACGGSGSREEGIEISLEALTQGTPHHDLEATPAETAVFVTADFLASRAGLRLSARRDFGSATVGMAI